MLTEPEHVWAVPFETMTATERSDFESVQTGEIFPEVGSRMMTRMMTGQDLCDGWIVVQDSVYRYGVAQRGGILVRSVLFEYLITEVYWSDY